MHFVVCYTAFGNNTGCYMTLAIRGNGYVKFIRGFPVLPFRTYLLTYGAFKAFPDTTRKVA